MVSVIRNILGIAFSVVAMVDANHAEHALKLICLRHMFLWKVRQHKHNVEYNRYPYLL